MSLTNDKKKEYANRELKVLDGLINYTERMIYQEQQQEYSSLRRNAYAKTVVIESELEGTIEFRLSSTSLVYPNRESGYATPHSPVGRLCSFVKPGYKNYSALWGDYQVVEIRLFDRFDGIYFEDNVRNFLRMKVDGKLGNITIEDLQSFVKSHDSKKPKLKKTNVAAKPTSISKKEDALPMAIAADEARIESKPTPEINLTVLVVDDDIDEQPIALDECDDLEDAENIAIGEYYGLNEVFFVNRTEEQEKVISRSPLGPMYVEGVAGSGKTSAALGRTKMLCDFNVNVVTTEQEFIDTVGEDMDYWSKNFAGKFSQEGSVGFVRTGELIQYLKETCRRLDLPHLPVIEYKELQSRLKKDWRVIASSMPGWRWDGLLKPRESYVDTTMDWLYAADQAIAHTLARELEQVLPTVESIAKRFVDKDQLKAKRIIEPLLEVLKNKLLFIQNDLRIIQVRPKFLLEGLAGRLNLALQEVRQNILGESVLWFFYGNFAFYGSRERDIAIQLISAKIPLFSRNGERLLFFNQDGLLDKSLVLLRQDSSEVSWSEEAERLLVDHQLYVRDGKNTYTVKKCDEDTLYLSLLAESNNRSYVLIQGVLRKISLLKGCGRELLTLQIPLRNEIDEQQEVIDVQLVGLEGNNIETLESGVRRSIDGVVARILKSALLKPIKYLADAYLKSLSNFAEFYPDTIQVACIKDQLTQKKLADEDIDLLLCISHLVMKNSNIRQLPQPQYYQSVFIDEVQDFTEQQIYLMVEQAKPEYRAVTIVGDIAQKLHHGSKIDIRACFPNITNLPHIKLTENIRQLAMPGLALFSACFRGLRQEGLSVIQVTPQLSSTLKMVQEIHGPEFVYCKDANTVDDEILKALQAVPQGATVAVILPTTELAIQMHKRLQIRLASLHMDTEVSEKVDLSRRYIKHFTSVQHAKGLEFDHVILPMLDLYDMTVPESLNRLYVGLTRARIRLYLLYATHLPKLMAEVQHLFNDLKLEFESNKSQNS